MLNLAEWRNGNVLGSDPRVESSSLSPAVFGAVDELVELSASQAEV